MKSPLETGPLVEFDVVSSTQDEAVRLLKSETPAGIVLAGHQTNGRGRFQRKWESAKQGSLTVSFVFELEKEHNQPWLYGMAMACAVSKATGLFHQWPNDIVFQTRKVGGILTEVVSLESSRRYAVIGLGLNLTDSSIPSQFRESAASLEGSLDSSFSQHEILEMILAQIPHLPDPISWADLAEIWNERDCTEGKVYEAPDGRMCIAQKIGDQGELIADFSGQIEPVFAADAFFGGPTG